jgi:L-lysine 2,3-aminomutase
VIRKLSELITWAPAVAIYTRSPGVAHRFQMVAIIKFVENCARWCTGRRVHGRFHAAESKLRNLNAMVDDGEGQ